MLISSFSGNLPPLESVEGTGLESMYERARFWQHSFVELKKSYILFFFGTGGGSTIYY